MKNKNSDIKHVISEPFWDLYEKRNNNNINNNNSNLIDKFHSFKINKNNCKNSDYNDKRSKKETFLLYDKKKEKEKNNHHHFSSITKGNLTTTHLVATMKDLCNSDKEKLAKLITKLAVEETKNQKLELKNKNYKSLLMEERIKNEKLKKTHNGMCLI
eukprot:jgi/Orpsp1_1/1190429/evm.model.d7180000078915.1